MKDYDLRQLYTLLSLYGRTYGETDAVTGLLQQIKEMCVERGIPPEIRVGRPSIDFPVKEIKRMQAAGMSNTAIMRKLGIPKATYYFKMRNYKGD